MDDLSKRLNDFLSSPESMAQLQQVMSSLGMSGGEGMGSPQPPNMGGGQSAGSSDNPLENMEMIMQIKKIYDEMSNTGDDPRLNLIMALKPYLSEKRLDKLDMAVKFIQLSKLGPVFEKLF